MWQAFVSWFSDVINLLYNLTVQIGAPSYGLAIVFMTFAIKLVLFPLTQKQLKSMRTMQEIQPKVKILQERYGDNKAKFNEEIMKLYQRHNVNPLGGCLPLIIQMPIFIAFYQSLFNFKFVESSHAGFLWIPNIGEPDPYYLLAIIAALTTYLQSKLSMAQSNDSSQKMMLYIMPAMIAFMAIKMPAGLPLYWVVFNILSIAQQIYVNSSQPAVINQVDKAIETSDVDKGGKDNNASPGGRKKSKKHR